MDILEDGAGFQLSENRHLSVVRHHFAFPRRWPPDDFVFLSHVCFCVRTSAGSCIYADWPSDTWIPVTHFHP
jgi:hypothetical protein